MLEAIKEMTPGEVAGWITLLAAGLATVFEVSKIKINPWTALARWIGRAINGELMEKMDKIEKRVEKIEHDAGEGRAKDARARVLRFGDELVHDISHSKEHFDDILDDITNYEKYCDEHPEFENDKMLITTQHIKETYSKCMKEHSFL